jgi:cytoskeleton protein RodZ
MDSTDNKSNTPEDASEVSNKKLNFGEWLKTHRIQKRISLEEIAAVTKVHITQLRWLEENEISKLPAPAFVRGFLVSYARHLGVDENEVLETYRKSFGSLNPLADSLMPTHQKSAQSQSAPKVRLVTSPSIKQAPGSKSAESTNPTIINFRLLGIGVTALVFIALFVFLFVVGRNAKKAPPPVDLVAQTQPPAVPVQDAKPEPVLPGSPPNQVATADAPKTTTESVPLVPKKFAGEVRGIETTWVIIRTDDEPQKGFSLKAGTSFAFEANRKAMINFSDAGNVEVKWNGTWYSPPGSRGDVRSLLLPRDIDQLTVKPIVRIAPKPKPTTVPAETPSAPAVGTDAPVSPPEE